MKHTLSKTKRIWITPDLSMKDFFLSEIVLDGHDELDISQLSLLLSFERTANETRLGEVSQVWSAGAGLIYLHIHTHAHTHTNTKTSGTELRVMQEHAEVPGLGVKFSRDGFARAGCVLRAYLLPS